MAIFLKGVTSSKPDFWDIHLSLRRCRQNYPPVSVAIAGRSPIFLDKRYTSSFMVGIVHCHVSFGHMIATSAKIAQMAWQNTLPETNSSHLKLKESGETSHHFSGHSGPGYVTRWWFQTFLFFIPIWTRFPFWLTFFKWVGSTTN